MIALPRGCANVVHGSFASEVYFAETKDMSALAVAAGPSKKQLSVPKRRNAGRLQAKCCPPGAHMLQNCKNVYGKN